MITDWQFEIDDGATTLALGEGTPYRVFEFDHAKPDIRATSSQRAREDGTNRGRDYLSSTTATLEIGVDGDGDPQAALDAVAALRAIWYGDTVRRTPGARAVLRAKRPGRDIMRVYGRPGAFKPGSLTHAGVGYIPVVAEFDCDDGYWYSDVEFSATVPFVPAVLGGLVGPLVGPWTGASSGEASGNIVVGGAVPAWLIWQPHGPITNPEIEVVGRWSATLQTTVAGDQQITVDPSPWNRSVRRGDGANFAGAFTASSERLSRMQVPPGGAQILLRGIDPTGTSYLSLFWRTAEASL